MKLDINLDLTDTELTSLKLAAYRAGLCYTELLQIAAKEIARAYYPTSEPPAHERTHITNWLYGVFNTPVTVTNGSLQSFLDALRKRNKGLQALEQAYILLHATAPEEEQTAREFITTTYEEWARYEKQRRITKESKLPFLSLTEAVTSLQDIAAGAFTSREHINQYYKYLFNRRI